MSAKQHRAQLTLLVSKDQTLSDQEGEAYCQIDYIESIPDQSPSGHPPICIPSMKAAAEALKLGLDGDREGYWNAVQALPYWGKAWLMHEIKRKQLARRLPPLEKPPDPPNG